MLYVLQHTPRIGVELEDDLGEAFYRKLVLVRRRRWTLHIVYRLEADDLIVEYIDASWVRRSVL